MSRRHFRKLAEALKNAKASDEVIEAIAYVCRSEISPRGLERAAKRVTQRINTTYGL